MTHAPQTGDQIADRYELEELVGTRRHVDRLLRATTRMLERHVALKVMLPDREPMTDEMRERFLRERARPPPPAPEHRQRSSTSARTPAACTSSWSTSRARASRLLIEARGRAEQRAIELAIEMPGALVRPRPRPRPPRRQAAEHPARRRRRASRSSTSASPAVDARRTYADRDGLGTCTTWRPSRRRPERRPRDRPLLARRRALGDAHRARVPFAGDNFVAVALRHVNEAAAGHPRASAPTCPPRLAAAIDTALQKDPARRFPTMGAFADELRACLAAAGERGRDPGDPVRGAHARTRARRRQAAARVRRDRRAHRRGCARRRASASAAAAGTAARPPAPTAGAPARSHELRPGRAGGSEYFGSDRAERDRRQSRRRRGSPRPTARRSSAASRTASVSSSLRRAPLR